MSVTELPLQISPNLQAMSKALQLYVFAEDYLWILDYVA